MPTQRVVFRKWKSNGYPIAFFLDQTDGPYVMSYEHLGQHGLASYPHPQTDPAEKHEYQVLLEELQQIGYDDLRIVKKGRVRSADTMSRKSKQYTFVFTFLGECCQRPHLWAESADGLTKEHALRQALKSVRANGREVSEYIEVSDAIGHVEEVDA